MGELCQSIAFEPWLMIKDFNETMLKEHGAPMCGFGNY
jgi:hypothetical protein